MKTTVCALSLLALAGCSTTDRKIQEVYNSAPEFGVYPAGTEFVSNWGVPVGRGFAKTAATAKANPAVSTAPATTAAVAAVVDTDGDGVSDDKDKCNSTAAKVAVNAYGCALTEKASIRLQVQFAPGSTNLDKASTAEVEKLAQFLTEFPQTKVEIAGHTDKTGSAAVNRALSTKRASAVVTALTSKYGIPQERLVAKGYGPDQPVAANTSAEGRSQNRRVVAEVTAVTEVKK